ncbi:MAG TPA: phosphopyruvate hydratase, partial [Candidatus Nanoarchaeia archaeon]|nr:phosphopyruvate hydratase [Candidatus Nanoarchaeia archaeon]
MQKLAHLHAREILDSRGNPTIEVDAFAGKEYGRAAIPSGASTGKHEAQELRDGGQRYGGKGVRVAVGIVNQSLNKKLRGKALQQNIIDAAMLKLDGSARKTNLGANAMLGVSLAV